MRQLVTYDDFGNVGTLVRLYITVFVLAGILLAACGKPEESKARYLERGRTYLEQGNYEKARVELKNVLQIDPKTAEAYNLLGQVEEQQREWRPALGYYFKAVELDPNLLDVHVRLGRFYLLHAIGQKAQNNSKESAQAAEEVTERINTVLKRDPEYVDALVLKASLSAYQGNMSDAVSQLEEVLGEWPDNERAILALARMYHQQKQSTEAYRVLEQGMSSVHDKIVLRLELASYYAMDKQVDKSIAIMEEVVRADPDLFAHRATLARYYLQVGDKDKAESVFRDAIRVAPEDTSRYLALAEFLKHWRGMPAAIDYIETGVSGLPDKPELEFRLGAFYREVDEPARAILLYEEMVARWGANPEGIRARKELAAMYVASGDNRRAGLLIEEILQENAGDNDALIIKGKLAVKEQDYDTAIASFRAALKYQPDSMELIHLLAESYVLKGDVRLAADTFKRATEIDLDDMDARLKLARFQLAAGQIDLALKQVEIVLAKQPDDLTALIIKSEAMMQQHNMAGVIKVVETMKAAAPDDAEGWFRMGRIYKLQKNDELARQEFITALEKAPDSESLLAELVDLEIAMGEFNVVEQRLDNILLEQPDHPSADKFMGVVYMADKDFENAEKAFQLHLGKSPQDVPVYLQAARACYNLGRLDDAAAYYRQGLLHNAANVELKSGLAGVYERQGEFESAMKLYNEILAANPGNAVAANNLALILVNKKGDQQSLMRAKQLVQAAGVEKHPALLDTLGWAHYKLGEYDQASSVLGQAVEKAPRVPVFHYHLGMAYHQSGDDRLAQHHLQRALAIGKFPGISEAQETLKVIQ